MVCSKCGNHLLETDKFCSSCGFEVVNRNGSLGHKNNSQQLLYIFKPTFSLLFIIYKMFLWIFLLGLIVFMLAYLFVGVKNAFLITILFAIVCIIFRSLFDYYNYKSTSIEFYADKFCYKNHFLNKINLEISYQNIIEIQKDVTVSERIFNRGKIKIFTTVVGNLWDRGEFERIVYFLFRQIIRDFSFYRNGRLIIKNIKDVNEVYLRITSIVDREG